MSKTNYNSPGARSAIQIIELLCESAVPMGARAICRETGLSTNMVFRLLKTLQEVGWITATEDETKYVMSLRAFHFISKPVKSMTLSKAARLPLQYLWEQTGESCYLGIKDGTQTLFLDHLDATGNVKITAAPGGRYPMHCAAPGKVLLAWSSAEEVKQVVKERGLPKQAANTISSISVLEKELKKIRKQGFAVDNEEYAKGLICYASPIFNYESLLVGTIGLSVLTMNYSLKELQQELGPHVRAAAKAISENLGYAQKA